jgi:hypothetical protein
MNVSDPVEVDPSQSPSRTSLSWPKLTFGPTTLNAIGSVCLILGIISWGLAIAGGIMLSTGVTLLWIENRWTDKKIQREE